jgi:hypothetical protein
MARESPSRREALMSMEYVTLIVLCVMFFTEAIHAIHVAPWDNSTHE